MATQPKSRHHQAQSKQKPKTKPRQMAPQATLKDAAKKAGPKAVPSKQWVGQPMPRKEDPRLIQGISHYADDLRLPGMLHCVFVRSPHAYAKINSVQTDAARAHPGVE